MLMFDEMVAKFSKLNHVEKDIFAEEFSEFLGKQGYPPSWIIQRESLLVRLHRYEAAFGELTKPSDYERPTTTLSGYEKLALRIMELEDDHLS